MTIDFTASQPPEGPVVEMNNVSMTLLHGYDAGLEDVTLTVNRGDLVMIKLEQGCIVYPLADILSGLQECTSGEARVFGQSWEAMGADSQAMARWRIGRVFSGHGWLSNLDVDENITLSERHHSSRSADAIEQEAKELAGLVDLEAIPDGRPVVVEPAALRKAEWIRAALGSPWLMILELPGRDMPTGWLSHLQPLVDHVRKQGTAVIWLCSNEDEWINEKQNPSLKLRAVGNKLIDEGRS